MINQQNIKPIGGFDLPQQQPQPQQQQQQQQPQNPTPLPNPFQQPSQFVPTGQIPQTPSFPSSFTTPSTFFSNYEPITVKREQEERKSASNWKPYKRGNEPPTFESDWTSRSRSSAHVEEYYSNAQQIAASTEVAMLVAASQMDGLNSQSNPYAPSIREISSLQMVAMDDPDVTRFLNGRNDLDEALIVNATEARDYIIKQEQPEGEEDVDIPDQPVSQFQEQEETKEYPVATDDGPTLIEEVIKEEDVKPSVKTEEYDEEAIQDMLRLQRVQEAEWKRVADERRLPPSFIKPEAIMLIEYESKSGLELKESSFSS
jgi:hypothetical protein